MLKSLAPKKIFALANWYKKSLYSAPCVKGRGPTHVGEGIVIMDRKYNKSNIPLAKALRKNMTKEEKHLWYDYLRTHKVKFLRQKTLGKYIVDFYSAEAKLIIELDGSQHYEEFGQIKDAERTVYLEKYGLSIIRIPNNEINRNFSGVCEYLEKIIEQSLHR